MSPLKEKTSKSDLLFADYGAVDRLRCCYFVLRISQCCLCRWSVVVFYLVGRCTAIVLNAVLLQVEHRTQLSRYSPHSIFLLFAGQWLFKISFIIVKKKMFTQKIKVPLLKKKNTSNWFVRLIVWYLGFVFYIFMKSGSKYFIILISNCVFFILSDLFNWNLIIFQFLLKLFRVAAFV